MTLNISMSSDIAVLELNPDTLTNLVIPPTLKKWGNILLSACPFVCSFVRLLVFSKKIKARVLKFHI